MKKLTLIIFAFLLNLSNLTSQNLDSLRNLAELGDAVAQFDLAVHYLNSAHTNYIEVLSLLRKSSKKGNLDATKILRELSTPGYDAWGDYYLVPQYDDGFLSEEVKQFLLEYATKGCKSSTCKGHKGNLLILAHSYFHEEQYGKAIYYYKQALSQMKGGNLGKYGDDDFDLWTAWMDAYTMLGYCYEHGYGVEKNYKTAIDYYFIGGIYLDEFKYDVSGIKKILQEINNPELTAACLKNGDGMMQFYDGLCPDPSGMRAWDKPGILCLKLGFYDIANELIYQELNLDDGWSYGKPISLLWSGEMYYKGLGRSQDYFQAYKYFNFIVESNQFMYDIHLTYPDVYADACYRLYECYAYGRGTIKNANLAEKYFKMALRYGSSSAIYDDQKHYEITEN